jgi:hypothetical protein
VPATSSCHGYIASADGAATVAKPGAATVGADELKTNAEVSAVAAHPCAVAQVPATCSSCNVVMSVATILLGKPKPLTTV